MITATAHDSVGADFLAGMARHKRERDTKQAAWHAELRRQGVVATHPDDGWIDRQNNTLHLCYPHIMGEVKPGALVALGDHEKHRIVRLLSYREWITALKPGDGTWSFANVQSEPRGGQTL